MFRIRTRSIAMLCASLVMLGTLSMPVLAGPGGNSDAAAACRHGGYRNFTDDAGNGFRNAGQCIGYVARGGTLEAVSPGATLTVSDNVIRCNDTLDCGNDYTLTGSGFLGEALISITFDTDSGYNHTLTFMRTDASGNFSNPFGWGCDGGFGTVNSITVTDGTNTAYATQDILCQTTART